MIRIRTPSENVSQAHDRFPCVRLFFIFHFSFFILFFWLVSSAHALDPVVDSVMYRLPALPIAKQARKFSDRLIPLWLEALKRPEADYQRQVALSVVLAHKLGMKGLETMILPLGQALDRPEQPLEVQLAIARALIVLDGRQAAAELFRQVQSGNSTLGNLIEPVLARWNYSAAHQLWIERLQQTEPFRASLLRAVAALGEVREQAAVPRLEELVLAPGTPEPVRLACARALSKIRTSGLEQPAQTLASSVTGRLEAASLLRHHTGEAAIKILQDLAADAEPAVAAAALERLLEIDPKLTVPAFPQILPSPDSKVQMYVVEGLFRMPSPEHIRLLGDRLDHAHPEVRRKARQSLGQLGLEPQLRPMVIQEGRRLLGAGGWRGQEQAAILLTLLDDKEAGRRLVELLKSARPEVMITTAWGLRRLAVPNTLPDVFEHLKLRYEYLVAHRRAYYSGPAEDEQLSHLIQFLALAHYDSVRPILRELLPRPDATGLGASGETRAATAWALGLFHEKKHDARLVELLSERVSDIGNRLRPPEDLRVRRMSAASLGRMKAETALPTLRRFYAKRPTFDMVNNACGWAIERMTGEKMPEPGTTEYTPEQWFLSPIESTDPTTVEAPLAKLRPPAPLSGR